LSVYPQPAIHPPACQNQLCGQPTIFNLIILAPVPIPAQIFFQLKGNSSSFNKSHHNFFNCEQNVTSLGSEGQSKGDPLLTLRGTKPLSTPYSGFFTEYSGFTH
jgi:hypothetical protein